MQNIYSLIENQLYEISSLLKNKISFEINAKSLSNANIFIKELFFDYYLRNKFFGNVKDNFIFIDLNNENIDLENIDIILLRKVSEETGIDFLSLNSLKNYIETRDITLVLYYSFSLPQNVLRFLYSYNYLLSNRVLHILFSQFDSKVFERKVRIDLSRELLEVYVKNQLNFFNMSLDFTDEVINSIDADIKNLPEIIKSKIIESANTLLDQSESMVEENLDIIFEEKQIANIQTVENEKVENEDPIQLDNSNSKVDFEEKDFLTRRENDLYNELLQRKFMTRQEVVSIVWGKSKVNKISNDAIDQLISRMRKKFIKAGYDTDYIYVRKGEGVGVKIG